MTQLTQRLGILTACLALTSLTLPSATAQNSLQIEQRAAKLAKDGGDFLAARQAADGSWKGATGPGITSLCGRALATCPGYGPDHPAVKKAASFVQKFQHEDGGFYGALGLHKNYETSVVVSFLAKLNDPDLKPVVDKAVAFLKKNQWDEDEEITPADANYGGAGYGFRKRPDLSNTQIMLDALKDSGLPEDDPAYQKALVFIKRCQMYGESNDQEFARGSTQGGFIYTAADGGTSKAGTIDISGRSELRAYGSMTYAGIKSMLYAGLDKNDPRVSAAIDWVRDNWSLNHNANMPAAQAQEGIYYYYMTLARALAAYGQDVIRETNGRNHHWRLELLEKLADRQRPTGGWENSADRWMEGIPELATAYVLIALDEISSKEK